jgi:hypothetical protein
MSDPTPITVIPGTIRVTPTQIKPTADQTTALLTAYLTPLLTAIPVTIPSGQQVSSFSFRILPDGSSTAVVGWSPISLSN